MNRRIIVASTLLFAGGILAAGRRHREPTTSFGDPAATGKDRISVSGDDGIAPLNLTGDQAVLRLEEIEKLPGQMARCRMLMRLLERTDLKDYPQLLKSFQAHAPVLQSRGNRFYRPMPPDYEYFLARWAELDPGGALRAAEGKGFGMEAMAHNWAKADLEGAITWISSQVSDSDHRRSYLLGQALTSAAEKEPLVALNRADGLGTLELDGLSSLVAEKLVSPGSATNVEALQTFVEDVRNPEAKKMLASALLAHGAQVEQGGGEAVAWLQHFEVEASPRYTEAFRLWALKDPEIAISALGKMDPREALVPYALRGIPQGVTQGGASPEKQAKLLDQFREISGRFPSSAPSGQ